MKHALTLLGTSVAAAPAGCGGAATSTPTFTAATPAPATATPVPASPTPLPSLPASVSPTPMVAVLEFKEYDVAITFALVAAPEASAGDGASRRKYVVFSAIP
jgi:hypothetical protein